MFTQFSSVQQDPSATRHNVFIEGKWDLAFRVYCRRYGNPFWVDSFCLGNESDMTINEVEELPQSRDPADVVINARDITREDLQ